MASLVCYQRPTAFIIINCVLPKLLEKLISYVPIFMIITKPIRAVKKWLEVILLPEDDEDLPGKLVRWSVNY